MKKLKNYGVYELNAKETNQIQGGGLAARLFGYIMGALANGVDGLGDEPVDSGTGLIIGQKW